MELIYGSETFGRPYMLPPGVPAERVAALREAFMRTMRDQELLAEARRIGVVIDPISGEGLQALADKIFATPAAVVARAKQAMEHHAPSRRNAACSADRLQPKDFAPPADRASGMPRTPRLAVIAIRAPPPDNDQRHRGSGCENGNPWAG